MNRGSGQIAVFGILLVLALLFLAIHLPCLMRSRVAANEASATATLRTLNAAEDTYASTYHAGFSDSLRQLGGVAEGNKPDKRAADLVDPIIAGNGPGGTATTFIKNGFSFRYSPGPSSSGQIGAYAITANPIARGSSGQRSFFTDKTGVVRANATAGAGADDNPI
jgi:type IV pilus assembly protein PilA